MMKAGLMAAVALAGSVTLAVAQNPQPRDSMRPMMREGRPMMGAPGQPGEGPEQIRMRIEERWGQMVQNELGLSDQQMERLRTAERANQDRHRDLNRREEDLRRSLHNQLQPGVAANADSVSRSLDALAGIRVSHAQSDQTLLRDLAFLTPVQRARYFIMAQRMKQRVEDIRERRPMMQEGPRPGARQPMRRPL